MSDDRVVPDDYNKLQEAIAGLYEKVECAWGELDEAAQCDPAQLAIRLVFEDNEGDLWHLFTEVEKTKAQQQSHPKIIRVQLRRAIVGETPQKSRSKVFATVRATAVSDTRGCDYLLQAWSYILQFLGLRRPVPDSGSELLDDLLPLSLESAGNVVGLELASQFENHQHRYCPVDLSANIEKPRKRILQTLQEDLITCEVFGEYQHVYPPSQAAKVAQNHRRDIWSLFFEHHKARHASRLNVKDHALQRIFFEDAASKADLFLEGVLGEDLDDNGARKTSRVQVLCILLLTNASTDCEAWTKFISMCCDITKRALNQPMLCDELLPLEPTPADHSHLGKDAAVNEAFTKLQYRFCAVHLTTGKQATLKGETQRRRPLPLLRAKRIGQGGFGRVYRVELLQAFLDNRKVAFGLFETPETKTYALKVMQTNSTNSGEWSSASELMEQPMKHDAIMRAIASVKTDQNIYILFPLADCNLRHYMQVEQPEAATSTSECKKRLEHISDIAKALQYLHGSLRDPRNPRRMALIHRDLKAENILKTAKPSLHLQVTDFGISSVVYPKFKSIDKNKIIDRNKMFTRRARSLRDMTVEAGLDEELHPNFAPELLLDRSISTKVDVWAFGTVFAEYLAWMLEGARGLKSFENARGYGRELKDDEKSAAKPIDFYCSFTNRTRPVVKPQIRLWFARRIKNIQDRERKKLYQDCLALLSDRLLVCKPSHRGDMASICEVFDSICNPDHEVKLSKPSRSLTDVMIKAFSTNIRAPPAPHNPDGPAKPLVQHLNDLQALLRASRSGRSADFIAALGSLEHNDATSAMQRSSAFRGMVAAMLDRGQAEDERFAAVVSRGLHEGIFAQNRPGEQLIHTASAFGMLRTVNALLDREGPCGSLLVNSPDDNGITPLRHALAGNYGTIGRALLQAGAVVEVPEDGHTTLLHLAVQCDTTDTVVYLTRKYPDLLHIRDESGRTALHLCAEAGGKLGWDHAAVMLNNEHGNPRVEDGTIANTANLAGKTPLFFATDVHRDEYQAKFVHRLLEKRAKVEGQRGKFAKSYGI